MTDTEIRVEGIRVLTRSLGSVEAERFITLILREPFDYTQWQTSLFPGKSVREISHAASACQGVEQEQRLAEEELG